jgi:hypothetical protein
MTVALGKLREILLKHADPSLLEEDITHGENLIAKNLVDDRSKFTIILERSHSF